MSVKLRHLLGKDFKLIYEANSFIAEKSISEKKDLDTQSVIKAILEDALALPEVKGRLLTSSSPSLFSGETPKRILIEFSSPNIAKTFHVGHLRSTLLGNFLANINEYVGHDVIRLNYLGDWGTQFGLLYEALEDSSYRTVGDLQDLYVKANSEAEKNEEYRKRALLHFQKLEEGLHSEYYTQWSKIRSLSLSEYTDLYDILGVHFDVFDGESMYSMTSMKNTLSLLSSHWRSDSLGRKVIDLPSNSSATLVKQNGSGLYLTRDVGAALDRISRFSPDSLLYVVENGQASHFTNLFSILRLLDVRVELVHVGFGRIHGLSSRKGRHGDLRSLLRETIALVSERQSQSQNTVFETEEEMQRSAVITAVSGIILQDFTHKRLRDFPFNMTKILSLSNNKCQYNHCRLSRLLKNTSQEVKNPLFEGQFSLLESEALTLLFIISQFENKLFESYKEREPSILNRYLNTLCSGISKAFKKLSLKDAETVSQASSRIILFQASKNVLSEGMRLLGVKPLNKM